MAFRVGQKVVCVDADPHSRGWLGPWLEGEAPVEGNVYTVKAIAISADTDDLAIQINEISRVKRWGYGAFRFRPAVDRKTDISNLKALLVHGAKIREDA